MKILIDVIPSTYFFYYHFMPIVSSSVDIPSKHYRPQEDSHNELNSKYYYFISNASIL